jgi:TPR repeat protein
MAAAQSALGTRLMGAESGQTPDHPAALKWNRLAAAQGDASGQNNLGLAHLNGWAVSVDLAQALHWFQKAAAQGYADAAFNLGNLYDAGHVVPQDHAKAVQWFRAAAVQKHTSAQVALADRYDRGRGVMQNDAKAHLWYNIAAASGHARATKYRDYAAKRMNFDQLTQAQKQATMCQQSGFKGCD